MHLKKLHLKLHLKLIAYIMFTSTKQLTKGNYYEKIKRSKSQLSTQPEINEPAVVYSQ